MNAEDAAVAEAVGQVAESIAEAIEVVADRLRGGGRLVYVGAGTSGRLGVLDASECPPTFNTRPWQVVGLIAGGPDALTRSIEGAEDSPETAVLDLQRIELSNRDVLVGIATSGRTPYVLGALRYATQVGAFPIGLSCNADSQLSQLSRITIVPVVGPEVISGSTRLKAGTATKMVLNMLTTGAMVRLGKTFGNLMVDLQTTNQKLADRSRRIVMLLTGLSAEQADRCLQRCGGDVKTAVVAHRRSVSPIEAGRLLDAARGQLRGALEVPSGEVAGPARAPDGSADAQSIELLLAVDGGGTKTMACLAERSRDAPAVLARGVAGPSNPQAVGWRTACENLQCAIDRAFHAAGLHPGEVPVACLAIAGAGRPEDQQRLEQWAGRTRLARQVIVTHDALAVLAAASPSGIGVALISGTGSIAFGRNREGDTARAGGWGHLFGDEGSGWFIAREALRAVAQAFDGRGPGTALTDAMLRALDAGTPQQLVQAVYQRQPDRVALARLSPIVEEAAAGGDAVAGEILFSAACHLADMYRAIIARLPLAADDRILALAGGTLVHGRLLREALLRQIQGTEHQPARLAIVDEPVLGALALARVQLGTTPGPSAPFED